MGPKGTQISMANGVVLICLIPALANIFVESLPQNGKSSITSESIKDGKDESEAKVLVEMLDQVFTSGMNKEMTARWNYIVNITDENEKLQNEAKLEFQKIKKEATKNISEFQWRDFEDEKLKRLIKFYYSFGNNMKTEDLTKMNELASSMESTYSTAKICKYGEDLSNCEPSMSLGDLSSFMAKNRSHEALKHVWVEWRKASGNKYKNDYLDFIDLNNEGAKELGFDSLQDQWLEQYEADDFPSDVFKVWTEETEIGGRKLSLQKFYKQLHAYVRRKLNNFYKEQDANIELDGRLPAHLMGNMWAQTWGNIDEVVKPFPDAPTLSATAAMQEQNYTAHKMMKLSESFFAELGFDNMTDIFWEKSMIEKPTDREVVCHASAEDFYAKDDFRIKQCTKITHDWLDTTHHEMGHIQYFMEYAHQPYPYRNGGNPGFHEAIGDTMALSVVTPKHLEKIGLLKKEQLESNEKVELVNGMRVSKNDLTYLFSKSLDKLAFLPFALAMDSWRWKLFEGDIDEKNMNSEWWKLRNELQGLESPVERTENDFDPGAKYHIPANVPYIRYFVSFVIQFQFYEALCKKSGQYVESDPEKPLYLCDFSAGGKETGDLIKNMMKLGMSKHWSEQMSMITEGETNKMTGESFLKYFLPLYYYLEEQNRNNGDCVGWGDDCSDDYIEEQAKHWLENVYSPTNFEYNINATQKSWEYNTNINDETSAAKNAAYEAASKYEQKAWKQHISKYNFEKFKDTDLKRRFQILSVLGTSALDETRLAHFNKIKTNMVTVYGSGKVCPMEKKDCNLETEGLGLEPGLEEIIGSPMKHSYEQLAYAWEGWRNATGRVMINDFKEYVDISNEVAKANDLNDASELWLENYLMDDKDFQQDLEGIWKQMQPIYEKLHGYVRYKFRDYWGSKYIGERDPLPAHIFGNMWAQSWENTLPILEPFDTSSNNTIIQEVKNSLKEQGYDATKLFDLSNAFYLDMGFGDMNMCYNTSCGLENTEENKECTKHNPLIEKPDWDVVCHASAWDDTFGYTKEDFRIKMCTELDLDNLVTIHHEMGHIQYYIQYKHLPYEFRAGANSGFHEAIGDTLALAVSTPEHLKSIGLIKSTDSSAEADINFLLKTGLEKLAFLPFAFTMDQYRWSLFNGTIDKDEMNYRWWELRERYQGIVPPVKRTEEDMDACAKYHIAGNVPYIRYFVSFIFQFQFYREMCLEAKQYIPDSTEKPLHRCDFSQGDFKDAAGKKLRTLLQAGRSRPWPDVLEEMTGGRKMDASAIVEYFRPLENWLDETIEANSIPVGWTSTFSTYFP